MSLPKALLVTCVIAIVIVGCLFGLCIASLLRRHGIFPRKERPLQTMDPNYPSLQDGATWSQPTTAAPYLAGATVPPPIPAGWQYPQADACAVQGWCPSPHQAPWMPPARSQPYVRYMPQPYT